MSLPANQQIRSTRAKIITSGQGHWWRSGALKGLFARIYLYKYNCLLVHTLLQPTSYFIRNKELSLLRGPAKELETSNNFFVFLRPVHLWAIDLIACFRDGRVFEIPTSLSTDAKTLEKMVWRYCRHHSTRYCMIIFSTKYCMIIFVWI